MGLKIDNLPKDLETIFLNQVLSAPMVANVFRFLQNKDLPNCYLTGGALYQTIWNSQTSRNNYKEIQDYDIFFYDLENQSEEYEKSIEIEIHDEFGLAGDVKNQARVHLWYRKKFGIQINPLKSSEEGISKFPVECTCVGINTVNSNIFSPFGLQDIFEGVLKRNKLSPASAEQFSKKSQSYKSRWPNLKIYSD